MLNVADIVAELDGNGFSQGDILDFSRELTQFTIMKDNLSSFLKVVYDDHELEEMLGTIKQPTRQQLILSNSLTSFSKREKQCYVMATVDGKSWGNIAKEIGISKGAVQQYIERARKKIGLQQEA